MTIIQELLGVLVTLLLAGNNLAVCVGPAVGSGVIRERDAVLLACVMFSLGLILGGYKFEYFSKLGLSASVAALCSALLALLLGETLKIPISLVYVTTTTTLTFAALAGSVEAFIRLAVCVAYWIVLVPVSVMVALTVAVYLTRALRASSFSGYSIIRVLVMLLTVILCLLFGVNNLGFLWALSGASMSFVPFCIVSTVLGVVTLGRGVLRKMVNAYALSPSGALIVTAVSSLVTYIGTELGVPVSFSVALICSLSGLSYAYRVRLINYRYIKYALMWTYLTIPLAACMSIIAEKILELL